MRVQLRDLSPGQEYAIQFRSTNREGAYSEWGQVYRFTTTSDTIGPADVTNLSWYNNGASFIGAWDRVTLDELGSPLRDFRHYRCNVSDGVSNHDFFVTGERFEFTRRMNERTFGSLKTSLTLKVWAVDLTYNESNIPAQVTSSPLNPPTPSTPVVNTYLGLLAVTWDGKDNVNGVMPGDLNYVEVHVSTVSGFTPTNATYRTRIFAGGGIVTISDLIYGTTYYVRLVAVNALSKSSSASVQASAVPGRITGLDIQNGQISTAQINFTAKDIGGANAYYVATTVARDALTGVKSGDIAYITGSGYAAYRYDGASWVSAPEVGVISGTKILAGTLTSDAVGTNLLITSSANIGTAVIDSANIASINAGKITAGSLKSSATVTYGGGASRAAWELNMTGDAFLNNALVRGQIVVGSSTDTGGVNAASLMKSFDFVAGSAGWAIKGDGTVEFNNGTFRGTVSGATIIGGNYRTALTGRRVEIDSSGSLGEIEFFAPDGKRGFVRSYTAASNVEAVQIAVDSLTVGEPPLSTAIFQTDDNSYILGRTITGVIGGYATGDQFAIAYAPNKADMNANRKTMLLVNQNYTYSFFSRASGSFSIANYLADGSNKTRFAIDGPSSQFQFGFNDTGSWMSFVPTANANLSPILHLTTGGNYGCGMYYGQDSAGTNSRLEIKDAGLSTWIPVWASSFIQQSSESTKEDIRPFGAGALEKVNSMQVKRYRRKPPKPTHDRIKSDSDTTVSDDVAMQTSVRSSVAPVMREEIGLIAEEAVPDIVVEGGSNGPMIDIYGFISLTAAAVQELSQTVNELKNELERRKKNDGTT